MIHRFDTQAAAESFAASLSEPYGILHDVGAALPWAALTGDDRTVFPATVIQVSATQMMLALAQLGHLDAVDAAVAASPNPLIPRLWDRAPTFDSDNPMVLDVAAAAGLSGADISTVFNLAQTL